MLTLTESQWQALQQGEARHFVAEICDEFLVTRPEMSERPGADATRSRMQAAYDYAVRAGFKSASHIMRLMYLAADAPRIHDDPVVDRYLRKPGRTPEDRLDDLDALLRHKLKEGAA